MATAFTDTDILLAIPVPDGATSWQIARAVGITPEMDEAGRARVQRKLQALKKAGVVEYDGKRLWHRKRDCTGKIIGPTERPPATYPPRSGHLLRAEKESRADAILASEGNDHFTLSPAQREALCGEALTGRVKREGTRFYAVYLKPDQKHPDALFYRRYEAEDFVNSRTPTPRDPRIVRVAAIHEPLDMGGTSR